MAIIDGITLAYDLDETSGTTVVDSHSTIDGGVNNETIDVAGKIGRAHSFDKSQNDEFIDLPQQSLSGDFTISWWDKNTANNMHIFCDKDNANVNNRILYQAGNLISIFAGGAGIGNFVATIGNVDWVHRCLTRSGSTITYYEDGSSVSTNSSSATIIIDALYAHPDEATSITWGEGQLDMFYLWVGTAKNATEVSNIYNSGNGLAYPFSAATLRKIKISGTFVEKPILTKVSGTFVDKPIKIKVGGTFQDA